MEVRDIESRLYAVLNNNEPPEINNHLSTPMNIVTQEKKNTVTPQRRPQVVINRHPENKSTFARETVTGNSTYLTTFPELEKI